MADSTIAVTPGSGQDVAFSGLGGALGKAQVVKLDFGADGAASQVASGNGLPVQGTVTIQDGGGSVTVDGTVAVSGSVAVTATDLDIRDLTSVSDSVAAVQSGTWSITNVSGTVSLPTGAATAAKQDTAQTALDAIKTAIEVLDNIVSGAEAQVDIVGALPAGANNIGDVDVASIAAGDNNIGNVDVVTVPADPFGANADAAATAGGTGSIQAKLRLATSQLDAIKTALEIVDDWDESDRAKVNLIVGQAGVAAGAGAVGATTQRMILASDDPAVTALQIIDDWDETDRCKVNIVAGQAGITAGAGAVAANTPRVTLASDDPAITALQNPTTTSRIISAAASTNATSAKASSGRVFAVQGYNASTAARYLKFYNKASAPTVGTDTPVKTIYLPPLTAFALDWPRGYTFSTGIAYALTTGGADADTGALTAADVLGINVDYA